MFISKIRILTGLLMGSILAFDTYLLGIEHRNQNSVIQEIDRLSSSPLLRRQYSPLDRRAILDSLVDSLVDSVLNLGSTSLRLISLGDKSPTKIGIIESTIPLNQLESIPGIQFVEKDSPIRSSQLLRQNRVESYGLSRISSRGPDTGSSYTFDSKAGSGVDVYILDSGINVRHRDFGGRAFQSRNFITSESSQDLYGHGTHVAGTVAGRSLGVAKLAHVHAVKILNKNGEGTVSLAIQAISHVIQASRRSRRKSIINLSLAGDFSQSLNTAVNFAFNENIPVVAAAGNQALDACRSSPSSARGVLAIGSTDESDTIADHSNHGPCVALFAPGVNIISAASTSRTGTKLLSGTSMAAPHVAGILALFWSQRPHLDSAQLYELTLDRATRNVISNLPPSTRNLLAYNRL